MNWRERPVVGLGLINKDFVAAADAVERDGKATAQAIFEQVGGPVPVALLTMARLGLDRTAAPSFVGVTGEDRDGADLRRLLEAGGVSAAVLRQAPDVGTSRSLVLLDTRDATRTLANWAGGLPPLLPFAADQEAVLSQAGFLHLDGRDLPASIAAAERVRSTGGLVSIDLGTMRPGTKDLLPHCDIVLASRKGGAGAFPDIADNPLEQVHRFLEWGATIAGVTLGSRGVCLAMRGTDAPIALPAFAPPGPTVDTCGAGDSFHGAFLWAYRAGQDAHSAADFAQAAVALRVTRFGNQSGLPSREEVEQFLAASPARLSP